MKEIKIAMKLYHSLTGSKTIYLLFKMLRQNSLRIVFWIYYIILHKVLNRHVHSLKELIICCLSAEVYIWIFFFEFQYSLFVFWYKFLHHFKIKLYNVVSSINLQLKDLILDINMRKKHWTLMFSSWKSVEASNILGVFGRDYSLNILSSKCLLKLTEMDLEFFIWIAE